MFKETHVKYSPSGIAGSTKAFNQRFLLNPIKIFFLLITYKHIVRITHSIYNKEKDSERVNLTYRTLLALEYANNISRKFLNYLSLLRGEKR